MTTASENPIRWRLTPAEPGTPSASAWYRGFYLIADRYGWTVGLARWEGHDVNATRREYAATRPSLEEFMAEAVAAADDLLAKGWQPR